MTTSLLLSRRVVSGKIILPVDEPLPESYGDIASANDHLHQVLNALLKERAGLPLAPDETRLINHHVAAKRWHLKNSKKISSV